MRLTKVHIAPSDIGVGVFASKDISQGETVIRFRGPLMDGEEVLRRKGDREGEVLQVGRDLYLDPVEPGRSVNHSCEPNAGLVSDTRLVALRDIRAGEEVRFDYSTTVDDEDGWEIDCLCGARQCRGRIRAFSSLPLVIRRRYLALGIVPSFMVPPVVRRREGRGSSRSGPVRRRRYGRRWGSVFC